MHRVRFVAAAAMAAAFAALTPVLAGASSAASERLAGVETGVPAASSECPSGANLVLSPFAGGATGSINGSWSTGACHGNIPSSIGQSVPLLPGGSFNISGIAGFSGVSLHGQFGPGNGSITLVRTTSTWWGGNTQVFSIAGPLTGGNISGGTMSITLTHYRFGTQTIEASITGSVTLSY
ncbi:MAG: hypothetical protein JOZ75_01945 [Candidatus Dormibacteraeota bacterium]|nr:hypothetical protein [Candidatus Dormibacteraeota bacterium]